MTKYKHLFIALFLLSFSLLSMAADTVKVKFISNQGDIILELYPDKAPITVKNFINYIDMDFYKKTIFHRVIKDFMIQGGGFTNAQDRKETLSPIEIESDNGLKNDRGTIAMARTSDPNSATSQFFINLKDNDFLNFTDKTTSGWGYAVFGKVISGMDIVDKIAQVDTMVMAGQQNIPVDPIYIEDAIVLKENLHIVQIICVAIILN